MGVSLECAPCGAPMTSWSARGSTVRYWQCPSCNRILSSVYEEVLLRCAVARRVEDPASPAGEPEDAGWSRLQARAERWFARLEREGRRPAAAALVSSEATAGAPLEG